jgi:hypothetical protein
MGHCISAVLFPPETEVKAKDVVNLPKGWKMAIPTEEDYIFNAEHDDWVLNDTFKEIYKDFLVISTDYFGGYGEQSCKIYKSGKFIKSDNHNNSINEGLKFFGLENDYDKDGFDTINLGSYRDNRDIEAEFPKKVEEEKIDLKNKITYVFFGDEWCGIFINDELITEGHSINTNELIEKLIEKEISMGELKNCLLDLDKNGKSELDEEEIGDKFNYELPGNLNEYIVGCQELGYKVKISPK